MEVGNFLETIKDGAKSAVEHQWISWVGFKLQEYQASF